MRPKGTQKLANLHSSRNYWHDISITNIYFQLTFIPLIAAYIQYKYIFQQIYIPNTVAEECTETPTKFQTAATSLHPHVVDGMGWDRCND